VYDCCDARPYARQLSPEGIFDRQAYIPLFNLVQIDSLRSRKLLVMSDAKNQLEEQLLPIRQALDLVTRQTVELQRLAAMAADIRSPDVKPPRPAR
jgi:hypothetical protein